MRFVFSFMSNHVVDIDNDIDGIDLARVTMGLHREKNFIFNFCHTKTCFVVIGVKYIYFIYYTYILFILFYTTKNIYIYLYFYLNRKYGANEEEYHFFVCVSTVLQLALDQNPELNFECV